MKPSFAIPRLREKSTVDTNVRSMGAIIFCRICIIERESILTFSETRIPGDELSREACYL
jgi:hypothetical protein